MIQVFCDPSLEGAPINLGARRKDFSEWSRAGAWRAVACTIAALVLALTARPALAHHAFAAEFDASAPVFLRGKVTKVEWINPHAWIHMLAEIPGKTAQPWMVEGGTPNTLLRAGINRNSLKPGDEIVVRGYQAKDKTCDPACRANGRDITLTSGQKLFMGSSGTGAPRDGADPTEPAKRGTPPPANW